MCEDAGEQKIHFAGAGTLFPKIEQMGACLFPSTGLHERERQFQAIVSVVVRVGQRRLKFVDGLEEYAFLEVALAAAVPALRQLSAARLETTHENARDG